MSRLDQYIRDVLRFQAAQPEPSRRVIALAIGSLILLWAILTSGAWAHWGDITIDCGREVYVPWVLSEGKRLYRDVWYPYGPVAPYFNALLYSTFGAKLNVLYWSGSLSALISALLILLVGNRVSAMTGGWAAGAIVLLESMVPGTIFNFPLPYSYSAVYGCVTSCLFAFFAVEAVRSSRWWWFFGASSMAALALALKLEIGLANYLALTVLMALRALQTKSISRLLTDTGLVLPGILVNGLLLAYFLRPGGLEFLVQQNWMSIPGTYFMKTYGVRWMNATGGGLTLPAAMRAALLCAATAIIWLAFWWVLSRWLKEPQHSRARQWVPVAMLGAILLLLLIARPGSWSMREWAAQEVVKLFFLQPVTFFFVLIAAALGIWACWRTNFDRQMMSITVLFALSGLLGLRFLHDMVVVGYPIYSSGLAILSMFLILRLFSIPFSQNDRRQFMSVDVVLATGMVTAVAVLMGSAYADGMKDRAPFHSSRGDLYLPAMKAERYAAAVEFMQQKAANHEMVLSVPEDSALYFFANVEAPTRVYVFTPGVLAPGQMTARTIAEIDHKPVDYLIWSNRQFREYGVPEFGKDFDQEFGRYLTSHYRPMKAVQPTGKTGWQATIWERDKAPASTHSGVPNSTAPAP